MAQQRIRRFFPGGNTTVGFYSFFDYILPYEEANRIYCLKGGPGTGKSSIMRQIGEYFKQEGVDIEYHHCSSDPDSLDAVVIKAAKAAILDGTAPHVVDPKYPGAVDEIINLGAFWEKEALLKERESIAKLRHENSRLFQKAYRYLKALGQLYEAYEKTAFLAFDREASLQTAYELIVNLLGDYPVLKKKGKSRHLFAFGITPKGIVQFREDYLKGMRTAICIHENEFVSSEAIMQRLKEAFLERGFDIICLHSPFKPARIVEILCDELQLLISADTLFYRVEDKEAYTFTVDLTRLADPKRVEALKDEVDADLKDVRHLLDRSVSYIRKAKENHHQLEQFYISALDFSKHEQLAQSLIQEIKTYL